VAELLRWPLPMLDCTQPKPIYRPKRKPIKKRPGQYDGGYRAYGVSGIHVPLEGKLGCDGWVVGSRSNP